MAEGLSAVAVNALPRAVARASWSARRIPSANDTLGRSAAMAQASAIGWAVFILCRTEIASCLPAEQRKFFHPRASPPGRRHAFAADDAEFICFYQAIRRAPAHILHL